MDLIYEWLLDCKVEMLFLGGYEDKLFYLGCSEVYCEISWNVL